MARHGQQQSSGLRGLWSASRRQCVRAALIVMTATASLALGLVSTVATAPPARADTLQPQALPPLPADPPNVLQPQQPTGDFSNPPPTAGQAASVVGQSKPSAFDPLKSNPLPALTTPTRAVYKNLDGTRTAIITPHPTRFQDATGAWQTIDLALLARAGGVLAATADPSAPVLAAQSSSGTLVTIPTAAGIVGFAHPDAVPVTGTASGSTATYANALPGARDIVEQLLVDGFDDTVILHNPGAPGSYTVTFTLPAGLSVQPGGPGVQFVDATGALIATFGGGLASDASGGARSETAVHTTLASVTGNVSTVTVAVDAGWLSAPGRVYPVRIDPPYTYYTNTASAGLDTYVNSDNCAGQYDAQTEMRVGAPGINAEVCRDPNDGTYNPNASSRTRSFIQFNLSNLTAASGVMNFVTNAYMNIYQDYATSYLGCQTAPLGFWDLKAAPSTTTSWSTQPAITPSEWQKTFDCSIGWKNNLDLTNLVRAWFLATPQNGGEPNNGFSIRADNDEYNPTYHRRFYTGESGASSAPALYVTYDPMPNPTSSVGAAPANGVVVATTTPALSVQPVTDPDGDPVQYWFKVATDPSGEGGSIVNSGWQSSPTWQVPDGSLIDGATYYWHVWTYDGISAAGPGWANQLTINLRLGEQGPSPYDRVGPVAVNLANGNLVIHAATPALNTVDGPLGFSLTYNSEAPSIKGLQGSYWDETADSNFPKDLSTPGSTPSGNPWVVTRDPQVYFDWGGNPPFAALHGTNWFARWSGLVTVPSCGSGCTSATYWFGAISDDGARIWVNGTQVLENWVDQSAGTTPKYQNSITLTPGNAVAIQVDYYQHLGQSSLKLYATTQNPASVCPPSCGGAVPDSWLTTTSPSLPNGWTFSAALQGEAGYTRALLLPTAAILFDDAGVPHVYARRGTAFVSPPDDDGVLATDASGHLTLHAADGRIYTFNADGTLQRITAPPDDLHPAAPTYTWGSSTGSLANQLFTVTDTVSGQAVQLQYEGATNGTAANPATANCPPPPSSPPQPGQSWDTYAPPGMLCALRYWDGTETDLFYENQQLVRIDNPGPSGNHDITDFGYSGGKVFLVRDPLATDAIAASQRSVSDSTTLTSIAYDPSTLRTASATLPAPTTASDPQPKHTYTYTGGSPLLATQTAVDVAGLSEPQSFARKVTLDGAGRVLTDTDATGRVSTSVWDSGDRLLAGIDPAGRETTTIYDPEQRPTDTYGPAPQSCFPANQLPTGCTVPHATTAYDEGIQGLGAAYWPNRSLAGPPLVHGTGVGGAVGASFTDSTGALNATWGSTGIPAQGLSAQNWSGRWTGEVLLPAAGTYSFALYVYGLARLYVDDQVVVDAWVDNTGWTAAGSYPCVASAQVSCGAGTRHRIRVDYATGANPAQLQLIWTPPGAGSQVVPGADLFPRYGLVTSDLDADGKKTATSYARPELGLVWRPANGARFTQPVEGRVVHAGPSR